MKELLVNINSIQSSLLLLTNPKEQIDEFGFVVQTAESRKEWTLLLGRLRHYKGGGGVGKDSGGTCKDLCKYLPHRKTGRTISLAKTGEYWCSKCECVMKCYRCRCCGRLGRSKPHRPTRRLNHPDTKFVE